LMFWRNSPHVLSRMENQRVVGEEEHDMWISEMRKTSQPERVYVAYHGLAPVGLWQHNKQTGCFGMYIGDTNYLGKGLGRVLLQEGIAAVIKKTKLHEIWSLVRRDNTKAIMLYKTEGFTVEEADGDFVKVRLEI
jgi:RimJ/RimL family protein N-acetyltransferase